MAMMVARLPKMKKSYHSIMVPAVEAAITLQIPAGELTGSCDTPATSVTGSYVRLFTRLNHGRRKCAGTTEENRTQAQTIS